MSLKPFEVARKISGSWQLPITEEESITITFFPNSHFFWTASANSFEKKAVQVLTGPDWAGNWHVRATKSDGNSRIAASSMWAGSFFGRRKTEPKVTPGPFLVLNYTDLTKSILNANLFGMRIDLANWVNNFCELTKDHSHLVKEVTDEHMTLCLKDETHVWRRVSQQFA